MKNNVTCLSDHRDLRIYIDDLIHVHLIKNEYTMFQSYMVGSKNKIYHIDIHTKTAVMELEYENKEIWTKILLLLDENI